jgi:Trk K+ transport system NAD-binding subunit
VAVERAGEIIMEIPSGFILDTDDDIYVCGTVEALNRFYDSFQQGEPPLVPATI